MSYNEGGAIAQCHEDIQRMLDRLGPHISLPLGKALDVGGGGGVHSALISNHVSRIYCTDLIDQNSRYDGQFIRLLSEKMQRNNVEARIERVEFHAIDAMSMPYRDNYFDLVVSFNAFEHIPNPEHALREMIRVTKPNGLIYITFDPIWTADSGGHFYSRVPIPWEHLLVTDSDYLGKMIAAGASEDECSDYVHSMSRLPLARYRSIFEAVRETVEYAYEDEWQGCTFPENINHENFAKCIDAGFTQEELLTRGICKILRKL